VVPLNDHGTPSAPFNTRGHLGDRNVIGVALEQDAVARIQELRARHQGKKQTARCGFPIDTRHEQNGIGWQPGAERISTTQHEQSETSLPLGTLVIITGEPHHSAMPEGRPDARWHCHFHPFGDLPTQGKSLASGFRTRLFFTREDAEAEERWLDDRWRILKAFAYR
jgi:hypothetical protein